MANLITLARYPLLFIYVALLYTYEPVVVFWCIPLIVLIKLMDGFDGLIARARGEVSLMGSVLDIATDRSLELVIWVVFAHLDLIPILIPILVIVRGTTVDGIRAVGMRSGKAAFDQVTHPISRFLVSSRFMREAYGIIKGFAFGALTLDLGLQLQNSTAAPLAHTIALILTWAAITLTILRGLPVMIEGYSLLKNPPPLAQPGDDPAALKEQ